ncbi:hypothetical protein PCANC_21100, partial [Puccinia coronata f. sp. avenae]
KVRCSIASSKEQVQSSVRELLPILINRGPCSLGLGNRPAPASPLKFYPYKTFQSHLHSFILHAFVSEQQTTANMLFTSKVLVLIAAAAHVAASTSKPPSMNTMDNMDMAPTTPPAANATAGGKNSTTPSGSGPAFGGSTSMPPPGPGASVPGDMSSGQCMCTPAPAMASCPGAPSGMAPPSPGGSTSGPGGSYANPPAPNVQPTPAGGVVSPGGTTPPAGNTTTPEGETTDSSGIVLSNPSLLTGLLAAGAVAFAL